MTPEEVHEKGLQEVERIYKKMIKVRRDTFKGHFSKNSEYDQEIPKSQTADNPMAKGGRATQPPRDTRKTN